MFEQNRYENLLASALARVPMGDKRESSPVYNGVAPSMAELAQLYIALDFVFQATYLSTAPREYLILRAADRNLAPFPATPAIFRGTFDIQVPLGARFSCEDLNVVVTAAMEEEDGFVTPQGLYAYQLACETVGAIPNTYSGALIPIEYLDGLTSATLVELLIPGDDAEDTEVFRQRVLASYQSQAFGGNRADYTERVLAIAGVSGVKVQPAWNGDVNPATLIPDDAVAAWYSGAVATLPGAAAAWLTAVYTAAREKKLTVGGAVKLVVMASGYTVPSQVLLDAVQTAVDPTDYAGEGLGLAPIGHVVHVVGVAAERVDLTLRLTYAEGWDWAAAKPHVEAVVDSYFLELAQSWAAAERITVRISQLESRLLSDCGQMIADLSHTAINGVEENLTLQPDCIPARGELHG